MRKILPISLVVCLLAAAAARADTITTFDVTGSYTSPFSGTFFGTLTIDVTDGTLSAVDITVPGFNTGDFDLFPQEAPANPDVIVGGYDNDFDLVGLVFTTATPNSLIGFDGGTIVGNGSFVSFQGRPELTGLSGSITAPAPAPEPSSLLLLAGALGCLGLCTRRGLKTPRPQAT